jgi:hypothetical protein
MPPGPQPPEDLWLVYLKNAGEGWTAHYFIAESAVVSYCKEKDLGHHSTTVAIWRLTRSRSHGLHWDPYEYEVPEPSVQRMRDLAEADV